MTEEELNKPITLNNLMETLVTFNEEKVVPRMKEVVKEMLDDQFKNKIKPEIIKAKQETMDYSDKKLGIVEGNINLKLNKIEQKLDKTDQKLDKTDQKLDILIDVFEDKKVIKAKDVARIKFAIEAGKT